MLNTVVFLFSSLVIFFRIPCSIPLFLNFFSGVAVAVVAVAVTLNSTIVSSHLS